MSGADERFTVPGPLLDPPLSIAEIVADAKGTPVGPTHGERATAPITSVSTDTRQLAPGALFVALKGPSFDGHAFVEQARSAGAVAALVETPVPAESLGGPMVQIVVPSTMKALADLARARRRKLNPKVVGITGSVGKTTTKELLAAILGHVAHTLATEGNLNNQIGVPLTLLRLCAQHKYAVIEMGMSAPGEIAELAAIALPDVGVVTRIAPAHLATMGTLDAIADAKAELFAAIPEAGTIVYPAFDERVASRAARSPARRKISFGEIPSHSSAAERSGDGVFIEKIVNVGPQGSMMHAYFGQGGQRHIGIPLLGRHNAMNGAAAMAAAWALGLNVDDICMGIAYARPAKRRSEMRLLAGLKVIDDCYNANPVSMVAALDALSEAHRSARSVAVLGDMLELGPDELAMHAEVGAHAAKTGLHALIAVGERSRALAAAARQAGQAQVFETDDPAEAARKVRELTNPNDWLLVKASRGTRLERVLDELSAIHKAAKGTSGGAS